MTQRSSIGRAGANSTLDAMADDGDDVLEGEMQYGDSRLASNACLSDQPTAQEGAEETTMTVAASVCSAVATLFTSESGSAHQGKFMPFHPLEPDMEL
jgi:hypothetical protein